jgi:hypothetical protein
LNEESVNSRAIWFQWSTFFFFAGAVSCCKEQNSTTSCNGISFVRFMVEFWDEKSIEMQSIFQVVIHAPSCWSLHHFLDVIKEVSRNENILSLILHQWKAFPVCNNQCATSSF